MELKETKLLVASSRLTDTVFGGSIVFLTEYDPNIGAKGIILNGEKIGFTAMGDMTGLEPPSDIDHTDDDGNPSPYAKSQMEGFLEEVVDQSDKAPLLLGGPCQTPMYMIHGHPDLHVSTKGECLAPGLRFGTPEDMVSILENTKDGERRVLFFMGIAGWFPGQLEGEVETGAWTVHENPANLAEVVWNEDELRKSLGGHRKLFTGRPGKPGQHEWN
jgi:putative AlgH/UPF0301 family transcriptional regulator